MGHWKDLQVEQLEGGSLLDEPGRLVCPDCIADEGLHRFVSRLALIREERCGFCGGPGPHGLGLQQLFAYMASMIAAEWGDPYHQAGWDHEDQDYVAVRTLDSDDLLAELGEPLAHKDLRAAFVESFQHRWCQRDPYRLSPSERLVTNWERFARYVKEESRYLFLRTGRSRAQYPDPDEIEPAAMLEALGTAIVNGGLIGRWPAGSELFRARQHRLEQTLATPAELGSPLRREAKFANRMSPAGIPMFYGAEDLETALAELRLKANNSRATVARWSTARELAYLDLVDTDVPSLFDSTARTQRPWRLFLQRFAQEVAQPVLADSGDIEYVPTQIVTEFVRHELRYYDGSPVRGIRYRSAARPAGVSWVLFVDAEGCAEAAPGWENDPSHWLGMDPGSVRRFQPDWTEDLC